MFPNWQNPGGGYAAQQAMGQWGQQQWGQIPPQHALWSGFVGLGAAQQQLPLPQLNISSVDGASTTNEQAPPLPSSPAPPVPVEPAPSEEQPPLPPEPPPVPPEPASQGSEKELKPKSNEEQEKLMQLQQQAQQWQQQQYQWPQSAWQQGWQQQQQWMAQYGYAQYQQPGGMPHQQPHGALPSGGQPNVPQQTAAKTPDNPAQIGDPAMDAILKEEAEFNQQYTQWKQQYDDWKAQNKNHPNKEQFQQYEHQWQTYEKQMEDKRLDITTRKRQIQQNIATKTEHQEDQQPGQHSRTPDQQFIGRGGPRFDGPRFPGPGGQGQMRGPRPGMEHGPKLGMEMGSRPRMEGGPSPRMGMRGPHPGGQKGGMARGQIPDMKGPRGPGPRFGQPGFGQFGNNDPGYDENQDMGGENFNYDEQNEGKDIAQEEDMDLEDNDEESNNMSQNQHGQGQRMGQNQMRGPRPFFGQGPRPSIGQGPRHQFGPRGQMGQGPMRGQIGQGMRGQMGQGPRGQFGQGPRFQANQNRMPQGQGSWMGQSGEQVGNQKESSETEEEYNDEDYDEQNPFDTGPGLREPKSFGRGHDISGGNPRMLGPRGRGQNFESNMRGAGPRGPSPFLRGSNPQMQQRGRPRGPVPLMSLSISKPQPSEESKVDLPLNQKEKLKLEQQRDQALQQGENWSSVQHKRQQKQNEKVEEGNKQAQQQKPNVEQADNKPVTDQNKAKTETSADNQKSQDDNKDQNNHDLMGNTTELKKNEGEKVKEDEEGVKPLGKGLGAVFNMLKSEGNKDEEPGEPQIPGFGDPPPDKNEDPNKNLKGLGHTLQMLQGGNEEGPSEDQNSQGVQEGFPNDFPWQEKLLGKMHEMLSQQEAPLQFRGRGNMGGARGRGRGRGHVNMRDQQEEFGQEDFDDQYGQENFGRGRGAFQQQGFEEQEFSPKNFRGRGGRGRGGFNRQDFEEQQEFSQQNTRGRGGHQDFGRGRGGFRGQGQENDFEEQGFSQQNIRGRGGLGRAQQAARGRGQRGGRGFGRGPHQEQRWGERGEWNEEDNGIQGRTEEEITQEDNEWNGSQAGREFDNRFDDRYPNQRPREGLDRWGDRRSPPPPRYPYGRPDDPFADRLDPYYDRRDPYPRDPYAYPPHGYPPTYRYEDRRLFYDDPYRPYDYGARYPVTPEVERPYQPPEVIDHGHKSSLDLGIEREPPAAYVAPQTVIDYGHGRTSDNSSRKDDRGDNLSSERSRYGDRDRDRDRDRDSFRSEPYGDLRDMGYNRSSSVPIHEPKIETVNVDDILLPPGRKSRPAQIVVIIRGLPGSGKSYVGKLLKDKEVQHGGGAPRMLCLDDYFMIETEKIEKDPETGKRVKKKILEYEYEAGMEDTYRQNMYKSFKKTIDDGFFSFIIVDAVNEKTKHYEEFWSHAKSKGFQVYIAELQADVSTCAKRNTHKRSTKEIEKIKKQWQETPRHYLRLDIRSLLQEASITEVEMEDEQATPAKKQKKEEEEEEADDPFMSRFGGVYKKSKWEIEASGSQLDKLDGIKLGKRKRSPSPQTMEDFLQLAGESSRPLIPGQKRVRWADIEERKEQMRRREIGFVVGQTQRDWERITDDSFAERQLNRTKYF